MGAAFTLRGPRGGGRAMKEPILIDVGEPIKVIAPAKPFKTWIIRGWSGRHGWVWWKGNTGRGDVCSYISEEAALREAAEIQRDRAWNPILIFPIEYAG